jgi:hypothetical protein
MKVLMTNIFKWNNTNLTNRLSRINCEDGTPLREGLSSAGAKRNLEIFANNIA